MMQMTKLGYVLSKKNQLKGIEEYSIDLAVKKHVITKKLIQNIRCC